MKSEDYKFNTRERIVTYTAHDIEIDGKWFRVNEILNLIEDLPDGNIKFNDHELEVALKNIGVIQYAWGGGYEASDQFEAFVRAVKRSAQCD